MGFLYLQRGLLFAVVLRLLIALASLVGLRCFNGLSLFAEGGCSLLRCLGFSLRWPLLLQHVGSRAFGLMVVAQGLSNPESESEGCLLCPTLCDPMDCIVHGILQARILE